MFSEVEIKTFKIEDLIGKKIHILSYKDGNSELIFARDMATGDLYVLKENIHPQMG